MGSPGGALLDFFFGERLLMRRPRDITANLLTICKRIGHDDIQAILKRELKRFDQDEQKRKAAPKPSLEELSSYETIQEHPRPSVNPSTSPRSKSPVDRRRVNRGNAEDSESPKLPPRSPSRDRAPEPLPKSSNDTGRSKSSVPQTKSPKPSPRSLPKDIPNTTECATQKENNVAADEQSIYDKPSYPVKRASFLHSSSAKILGSGSPSRVNTYPSEDQSLPYPYPSYSSSDERRSQSLPKVPSGEELFIVDDVYEADDKSNTIPKNVEARNVVVKEEAPYADIPESERHILRSLPSSSSTSVAAETKKHFEIGYSSRQEVQQKLSKAVHKGGVKMLAAKTSAVTQLKGMMNATGRYHTNTSRLLLLEGK